MATLATLRSYLNAEIGVTNDAETSPYSQTARNRAIGEGYAALWTHGVGKPVTVDAATDPTTRRYVVTGIQSLERAALFDSTAQLVEDVATASLRQEGTSWVVTVPNLVAGYTLRLFGRTPYKSVFSGDADTDDLAAEWNYIPLLRAAAICYRQGRNRFMRYGSRQTLPPEMNVTIADLLAGEAAAMRQFEVECKALSDRRPRVGRRVASWRGD